MNKLCWQAQFGVWPTIWNQSAEVFTSLFVWNHMKKSEICSCLEINQFNLFIHLSSLFQLTLPPAWDKTLLWRRVTAVFSSIRTMWEMCTRWSPTSCEPSVELCAEPSRHQDDWGSTRPLITRRLPNPRLGLSFLFLLWLSTSFLKLASSGERNGGFYPSCRNEKLEADVQKGSCSLWNNSAPDCWGASATGAGSQHRLTVPLV